MMERNQVECGSYKWDPPSPDPVIGQDGKTVRQPGKPTIVDIRGVHVEPGQIGLFPLDIQDRYPNSVVLAAWDGPEKIVPTVGDRRNNLLCVVKHAAKRGRPKGSKNKPKAEAVTEESGD